MSDNPIVMCTGSLDNKVMRFRLRELEAYLRARMPDTSVDLFVLRVLEGGLTPLALPRGMLYAKVVP